MSQQTDQGAGWGRVGSARADEARRVERRLAGLRRRMKALLVGERGLRLVAVLVGAALLVGLADYLLRAPAWVRLGVWVAGAAAAAWWARRLLGPVLAFRPRLADVALRLEESPAGRAAQLPGVLAAGYEFAAQAPGLTDRVVSTAAARLERLRAGAVTDVGRLGRAAALAVLALAAVTALGVAWPALTAIGARRVLAPWSGAEWPRRTELADVTGVSVHPLGTALPLRAALVRTPGRPESARVWARYRVDHGEGFGPAQRVLLTGQDRQASVPPSAAEANQQTTGLLFERLIEPAAVPGPAGTPGAPQAPAAEVEYWFEAGDDRTDPARVALVTPPLVVGARAVVTPPAYVGAALGAPAGAPRELDLGSGTDERAAPPGLLQGSRVELTIELNKPVPGPVPGPGGVPQTAWLESAFGAEAARALVEAGAEFRAGPRSWALGWTLGAPVRLLVTVTDEHGLSSAGAGDQAVYRFEPVADAPPTAAVIRPDADRTVLPSAVVELAGEARDDIAVGAAELQQRVARRPAGSGGAPAEPDPQWAAVRGQVRDGAAGQGGPLVAMTAVLELGGLDLKPGDEVLLSVLASDTFEHAGQVHEPVRSPARKLAIISTEEFVAQAWGELEQVRQGAMRIEEDQAQALDQARRADGAAELAQAQQAQGVLSERAAREREAVARLEARVRENRLTDAELRGVLDEAARLLDAGGRASNQAGEALGRAAEAEDGSPQRRAQQEEATRAQEEAREAAGDLAELLNRGQDTWAMRRALARLLEEQRRIRDETRELGQRTAGQSAQDLQPAERQALEQLAQDQAAAAAEAREALDTMNRRQEQLQERDPAAARAAQQAARRGEQDRLPQRLEEAAEQVRQNQTSSAGAQQDRAIKTLEEMLEDMEGAAGARDEALRRLLADLMDSIRALIDDQEAQLAALAARPEPESARGLDAGMIRLNQNTLAAADQARQEDQSGELGPVLELLGQAAEAQAGAVTSLRAQPIDLDRTRQQEELSLARLKRALEEAEKLDQDAAEREAARKTAELKKAYREALAEQVALQEQTVPLAGEEPSRRTRAQARSLAPRQESLRQTLARLREETEELSEAVVFDLAHDLLDELMAGAAAALGRGEAGPSVLRDQDSAAGVLRSLIESLERDRPGDEFDENEQGGGGGGGQPGKPQVVPPVAQLKLLRAMQARAMELTRRADESGDAALAGQAAALQRALAERGQSLLESLAPERPGEEPEAPQDDAPDADGDAEDQPSPEGGEE